MVNLGRWLLHSLLHMRMGRVTVLLTQPRATQNSYIEHKLQKNGPWPTNTIFITQMVLCEAPYYLASLYYIHAQHEKSLPFTYNLASVIQKTGRSSLCRPCSQLFLDIIVEHSGLNKKKKNEHSFTFGCVLHGFVSDDHNTLIEED